MTVRPLVLAATLCAAAVAGAAETLTYESSAQRVALVELYTSEGCSSCPPADRWLSALRDDPRLWKTLVPVAFHVDYWNYIGWPDRFSSPAFSARQREHARQGAVASVYPPGFVVHGDEWRGWFRRPELALDHPPPAGILRLELDVGARSLEAGFTAAEALDGDLDLHVAILGFDIRTEVTAGENEGRTLRPGHETSYWPGEVVTTSSAEAGPAANDTSPRTMAR